MKVPENSWRKQGKYDPASGKVCIVTAIWLTGPLSVFRHVLNKASQYDETDQNQLVLRAADPKHDAGRHIEAKDVCKMQEMAGRSTVPKTSNSASVR